MSSILRIVLIIASISFLYLLLGFHTDPQNYRAKTRFHLKYAKLGVAILEDVSKKTIVDVIAESNPELEIGFLSFSNTFLHYKTDLVDDTNSNLNAYLVDGWGIPLNVGFTTNVINKNDSRWPVLKNCGIVLWSSGANHKDDRCHGDDIVWMDDDHL